MESTLTIESGEVNLTALILVLTGSLLHLGWNVLAKKAEDKLAYMWLAIAIPGVLGSVYTALNIDWSTVPATSIICNVASMGIHALYIWALTSAYHLVDMSLVYPYCRGIGALLGSIGGVLILRESPSALGAAGIALSLAGTFIEPVFTRSRKKVDAKGVVFTAVTGALIASYLIVDKIGVAGVEARFYLWPMLLGNTLLLSPFMLKGGRWKAELKRSGFSVLSGSFFLAAAYGVVLEAMAQAPVVYVVAARATGIVFSGVAGIWFFKETVARTRWAAIFVIAAGVVLIGLS